MFTWLRQIFGTFSMRYCDSDINTLCEYLNTLLSEIFRIGGTLNLNWILVRRTFFLFFSFSLYFSFLSTSSVYSCEMRWKFIIHLRLSFQNRKCFHGCRFRPLQCLSLPLLLFLSLCSSSTVYVAWMVFFFLCLSSKCVGFLFGAFLVDTRVKCITLFTLKFCAIEISNAFSFGIVIYE